MPASASQTNHRLYLARLQLDSLAAAVSAGEVRRAVLLDAFGRAAVLHLQATLGCLLQELTEHYRVSPANMTIAGLAAALDAQSLASAECFELQELADNNWLGELLAVDIHAVDSASARAPSGPSIALQNLAADALDVESLESWYGKLRELIPHIRESMQEW